jgi:ELWxxDGT repeat protein
LANVNGTLFFAANDGARGAELWRSDGTAAGTMLVKDIFPGPSGSVPSGLVSVGDKLFLIANDGTHGQELWVSDGTDVGTMLLADIAPGVLNSNPSTLRVLSGNLLFWANDGVNGFKPWKTDGTPQGTSLLKDIGPGPSAGLVGSPYEVLNGWLFLSASDGTSGAEPWVTDGTPASTRQLVDVAPGGQSSFPRRFMLLGGRVVFTADDGTHGRELWTLVNVPVVNHPPSFAKGDNVAATDEDGLVNIPGWATAISAGAASEAEQQLTFVLTVDRPELFAVQPAIDAAGTLTFRPLPNVSGAATITVVLADDGGTANGGSDRSLPQSFTIEITKPRPWHNVAEGRDVDADAFIAPGDALWIINYINAFGAGPVPAGEGPVTAGAAAAESPAARYYYDVDGDGIICPLDALLVINLINARTAHATLTESPPPPAPAELSCQFDSLVLLLAEDVAGAGSKRQCLK